MIIELCSACPRLKLGLLGKPRLDGKYPRLLDGLLGRRDAVGERRLRHPQLNPYRISHADRLGSDVRYGGRSNATRRCVLIWICGRRFVVWSCRRLANWFSREVVLTSIGRCHSLICRSTLPVDRSGRVNNLL